TAVDRGLAEPVLEPGLGEVRALPGEEGPLVELGGEVPSVGDVHVPSVVPNRQEPKKVRAPHGPPDTVTGPSGGCREVWRTGVLEGGQAAEVLGIVPETSARWRPPDATKRQKHTDCPNRARAAGEAGGIER